MKSRVCSSGEFVLLWIKHGWAKQSLSLLFARVTVFIYYNWIQLAYPTHWCNKPGLWGVCVSGEGGHTRGFWEWGWGKAKDSHPALDCYCCCHHHALCWPQPLFLKQQQHGVCALTAAARATLWARWEQCCCKGNTRSCCGLHGDGEWFWTPS